MNIQEIDDQLFDAREALRDLFEQTPIGDDLKTKAREAALLLYEIRIMMLSIED